MKTREKIINRLNKMGFDIPMDTNWVCRQRKYRDCGGFSWCLNTLYDLGSCEPANKVLKWKKWAISPDGEISEYFESASKFYEDNHYTIES